MSESQLLDLWHTALINIAYVGGPFIVAALVVGLGVAVIQAATQVQENILSFVPKLMSIALILGLCGPWLLDRLGRHARANLVAIETLARSRR